MGCRANFVIVDNKKTIIYYCHDGGYHAPEIVAKGLEYCEKYFQELQESDSLMDIVWAEGGILIDKDKKNVLLFGGEDPQWTPALQRIYCQKVVNIWQGWNVQWCEQGIVDMAVYLGLMEERIYNTDKIKVEFDYRHDIEWSDTFDENRTQDDVITIIDNGVISDYKLDYGLDGIDICILKGKILKDIIPDDLKIRKWQNEAETTSCLLLDYDSKKLFVCWGIDRDDRFLRLIEELWNGWKVIRQNQGLVFHFDYTNRDRTIVEMTGEQFDSYKLFEFESK